MKGKEYTVHSVAPHVINEVFKNDAGEDVEAGRPALIIELVPVLQYDKTLTMVFPAPTPEALKSLNETFPIGGTVAMGAFELVKGPEAV